MAPTVAEDPRGYLIERLDAALVELNLTSLLWLVLEAEKLAERQKAANNLEAMRRRKET